MPLDAMRATGARVRLLLAVLAVGVAGALASTSASAQATIDQNKALAGGVTPGFPITVDAPGHCGVTIDLNGFSIQGPASCVTNNDTRVVECGGKFGNRGVFLKIGGGTTVRSGRISG